MNARPGTRIVAILALIALVFSITEKAFAEGCVHDRGRAEQAVEAEAGPHVEHAAAGHTSESSDDRSDCRHDSASGCAASTPGIASAGYAVENADEVALVILTPSSAIDLIATHSAFHPPRA
jgi:hypothetical protein